MTPPQSTRDPIVFELVKNTLGSIADQMAFTIVRTAYSAGIKAAMDFSTALCDADGQMLAQGLCLPLHLGAMPTALGAAVARYGDELAPGDVILLNDPFEGGMHLPDFFVIRPIFLDNQLLGFAVAVAHQQDVGGRVPGSGAVDTTEVFAEGLRIPPLKLYERGVPNETLFRLIEKNVRLPDRLMGDLRAELSACYVGEQGMLELGQRYGAAVLRQHFAALLDYTEHRTRQEIARLPSGTYRFTDYLDSPGTSDEPIPICVAITISNDEIEVDFAGTGEQVNAALNATLSSSTSGVYLTIRSILDPDIPNNAGYFRPIRVCAPLGTIVNPVMPAATAARGLTVFRVVDAMLGALAQAVPERVMAASEGGNTTIRIGGYGPDGKAFLYADIIVGSWGGRSNRDGLEGVANIATNLSNEPVELVEVEHPVRIERYGFVPDSGGPGKYRGGLALTRDIRFLGNTATLQIRSDRRRFPPYGLFGGQPGTPSDSILNPEREPRQLPAKVTTIIHHGDLVRHITPGAGGYGDPLERKLEAVAADLRNEKLSPSRAFESYGTIIDRATGKIDPEATAVERARRRLARIEEASSACGA